MLFVEPHISKWLRALIAVCIYILVYSMTSFYFRKRA